MNNGDWTDEISSKRRLLDFKINEVLNYKDLLLILVKRDFVSVYKQTILGPLWYIVQPLITALIFSIIFGKIAKISTSNIPFLLFYLSGLAFWQYFSDVFSKTSNTFIHNQAIFGKVYFPRVIVPLSVAISSSIRFFIQYIVFLFILTYYMFTNDNIFLNQHILLAPLCLFFIALLAIGLGLFCSSLTIKYKDLVFLISFGLQVLMYMTPIIYPLEIVPDKLRLIVELNPLTAIIELVRNMHFGKELINTTSFFYSGIVSLIIFIVGILFFNKTEQNFMDTV